MLSERPCTSLRSLFMLRAGQGLWFTVRQARLCVRQARRTHTLYGGLNIPEMILDLFVTRAIMACFQERQTCCCFAKGVELAGSKHERAR
jgi:hypothetical protein